MSQYHLTPQEGEYTTPKACYIKAPVRRETFSERAFRRRDQVPRYDVNCWLVKLAKPAGISVNRELVPGSPKFVREVTTGV